MGINYRHDIEASMQIGQTEQGKVRISVEAGGIEIPLDFGPEEAAEIAEEIRVATIGLILLPMTPLPM
ncbi:hypothetical protein CLV80_102444 [Yoonia maritima]|uniref:Uncharacterized protein n=1 Tax=Yoonia maritima TaxID=1435347 RepID=A0A2T0W3N0_9RHOB|nr:DUF6324 family protein [Yoonia maritima]PRY79795.1 hypothetical protein CLV80_102444 [Yoonia maritima]